MLFQVRLQVIRYSNNRKLVYEATPFSGGADRSCPLLLDRTSQAFLTQYIWQSVISDQRWKGKLEPFVICYFAPEVGQMPPSTVRETEAQRF